ncbi:MAG: hypothetical protein ACPG1C_08515, partial [Alphaproteobacteria bacterium]
MPQFDQSVGKMGRNLVHDVASLQAAFLLLKQHKRIDLWSGPVDGDWNRHKQSLEAAITALEKQLNHSGGIGRIDPRSPLANKLKQMLPMQYQSLAGIKNTACLIIAEPYARRHDGPQVKDMALPERCQQDLERLIKDGSRNLGLELVVDTAKTDHTGRCVITLKPHGVKCLDDRLKPLQPHQPTP